MKQTNDESKQQAMTEQQAKDKQAVKDKQREAALQERKKNVLAIAKPMYGGLKSAAHRLHSANFSLQPILQVAAKLLSGVNKQRQAKRLRNEVWRGVNIESMSSEEKIRAAAIPGVAFMTKKSITSNEADNELQGRQRTRTATDNTGKRKAIMGNALLAAKATVPTTNSKQLKSNGKYAVAPLMPTTAKSSGKLNDVQTKYSVLAGMRGVNTVAANEVRNNPGTISEMLQQKWGMKPEHKRSGVYQNHMQAVNRLNVLTTGVAALVHKQRNRADAVGIIDAVTTNQLKGTKVLAPLLRTNSSQTKKSIADAGVKQPATFLKNEPVALLQQAKGVGEKMIGSGIDAKQHASGNGAAEHRERQVALHMTQPMIGSLTIHCASTTDAVTDIGNKVEEALLAILESANAIH